MARPRIPTSKDVARVAGVSQATVSAVLSGTRSNIRVSAAVRRRVQEAAAELNYLPSQAAQSLRRQRSGVLGYIPRFFRQTPYERPVPFYLSTHIARAAMAHGYQVIEVNAESSAGRSGQDLIEFLLKQRIEGAILDAPESADEVLRFVERGIPVVQLLRPQLVPETATITVDPWQGMSAAVAHLVELGHQRIAYIATGGENPVDSARQQAFLQAAEQAGINIPSGYLQRSEERSASTGYQAMAALLELPDKPTALIVTGDVPALGVLRLLYARQLRVPDAMSIVSYDDTFAEFLYPPLTSIGQPYEEIGQRVVALLANQLAADQRQHIEHIILPTRLIIRESTAAPSPEHTDLARSSRTKRQR